MFKYRAKCLTLSMVSIPRTSRDRLMLLASIRVSPRLLVRFVFSLPARSTRHRRPSRLIYPFQMNAKLSNNYNTTSAWEAPQRHRVDHRPDRPGTALPGLWCAICTIYYLRIFRVLGFRAQCYCQHRVGTTRVIIHAMTPNRSILATYTLITDSILN